MTVRSMAARLTDGSAAVAVLSGAGAVRAAKTMPAASVEEVMVTAQKRSETIQMVPMAITALNNRTLVVEGIRDSQD